MTSSSAGRVHGSTKQTAPNRLSNFHWPSKSVVGHQFPVADLSRLRRERKHEITFLDAIPFPRAGSRESTSCMPAAGSTRLVPTSAVHDPPLLGDQFQDYAFPSAFIQLYSLPAILVRLQEFGLPDIFLQFL